MVLSEVLLVADLPTMVAMVKIGRNSAALAVRADLVKPEHAREFEQALRDVLPVPVRRTEMPDTA